MEISTSVSAVYRVTNPLGLHARASAVFVMLNSKCFPAASDVIEIVARGQRVNGKSIMGLMMLAAYSGSQIELRSNADQRSWKQYLSLVDCLFLCGRVRKVDHSYSSCRKWLQSISVDVLQDEQRMTRLCEEARAMADGFFFDRVGASDEAGD